MATTAARLVADATSAVRGLIPAEVEAHLLAGTARVLDVREPDEIDEHGLIAGAYHVPRGQLELWADPASASHRRELDPAVTTIVYSGTGERSALAAEALQRLGYHDVAHLRGGLRAWAQQGYPVAGLHPWHRVDRPITNADTRSTS